MILFSYTASSQVVINEIMTDNVAAHEYDAGFPDYIELYNAGTNTADLGGMGLTDDPAALFRFTFPVPTGLPAKSFLVVYADNKTNAPGLHTGFGLSKSGGILGLYTAVTGLLVEHRSYGLQLPDRSISRVPDGTTNWTLSAATPGDPNEAVTLGEPASLSINEWMPVRTNSGGIVVQDGDWLELYNGTNLPVHIGGLILTDGSIVGGPVISNLSFVGEFGFIEFHADDSPDKGPDHLPFKLSSTSGETLTLYGRDGITKINEVSFGKHAWTNWSTGRLPDGDPSTNYTRFAPGLDTPGRSNLIPITNVVINEVLTHTDTPLEDAFELYNPTSQAVDISNWWISDDQACPRKFRMPNPTIIPAYGYKVFYEYQFNPGGQGIPPDFTFNSFLGEEINLFSADAAGKLTGYRLRRTFGATLNGISMGRHVTSDGTDFVPMAHHSFGVSAPTSLSDFRTGTGATNTFPRIGRVVLSEIMYRPPDVQVGSNFLDNSMDEYIEVRNATTNPAALFHPDFPTNTWKLRDAVSFQFPQSLTLTPGESILVVNFDPATNAAQLALFRAKYNVPSGARIFGPYGGKLSNSGENVELVEPDTPQGDPGDHFGYVPYVLVERVAYKDKAPWPVEPDGTGAALHRIKPEEYGNEPLNWKAGPPTPGWDDIQILACEHDGGSVRIRFFGLVGSGYRVYRNSSLDPGGWSPLTDVPAKSTSCFREPIDGDVSGVPKRFYRIGTQIP